MKHFLSLVAGLFFLTSFECPTKTNSENASKALASETLIDSIITIDGTGWIATDLTSISDSSIRMIINLPKNAKMEKNGNGGVDIHLNEAYTINVSYLFGSVKEAVESDKSLYINNKSYKNGKMIIDESNGNVYSKQMKDEANGIKYEPEAHFTYYLESKDGGVYSIMDVRPMNNFFLPGSTYTEDNAKKLYAIIKASAKLK